MYHPTWHTYPEGDRPLVPDPSTQVTIISESQANLLLKNDKMNKGDASGEILNNTGTMEYHQATRQLAVNFRSAAGRLDWADWTGQTGLDRLDWDRLDGVAMVVGVRHVWGLPWSYPPLPLTVGTSCV